VALGGPTCERPARISASRGRDGLPKFTARGTIPLAPLIRGLSWPLPRDQSGPAPSSLAVPMPGGRALPFVVARDVEDILARRGPSGGDDLSRLGRAREDPPH
jgi:hypothetical protein